jgi:hypothetical protein
MASLGLVVFSEVPAGAGQSREPAQTTSQQPSQPSSSPAIAIVGTAEAESRANSWDPNRPDANRGRWRWEVPEVEARGPTPNNPTAWYVRADSRYSNGTTTMTVGAVGQTRSLFPIYLTETLPLGQRSSFDSSPLQELSGRRDWSVSLRLDRRIVHTRGGTTVNAFTRVFLPVGRTGASEATPPLNSIAIFAGITIGF